MMSSDKPAATPRTLAEAVDGYPRLAELCGHVVGAWPEHDVYLAKSFALRTADLMATSDRIAGVILKLVGDAAPQVAADYRWLCDRIQEEEYFFAREDRYRFSSFEEANANVYSDDRFMARYMHGLLFSHVLWVMHASSLHFFVQRIAARCHPGGQVLEIGSGHGLLLYLALEQLGFAGAHGWDLSSVSLAQTRHALETLGAADRAHFAIRDMHRIEAGGESFDLVILSHILEHLEDPVGALAKVRQIVPKDGYLFVNVPLNAPMPDHLVLLRNPAEATALLEEGGFRVLELGMHTTQHMPLPKALKRKVAVTCSIIAQPS